MARKEIKTTLIVEDKTFVNDKGEAVPYTSCTAIIAGQNISLSVKTKDKGLLDYLVSTVGNEVK